jgi:iron complex transport system ATP-binding protein
VIQLTNYSDGILKNIHFELKPKQNLIILGANGAGKSTLAKVLCGITPSSSLLIQGKPLSAYSTKERTKRINYVPAKLEIFDEYITLQEYLNLSRLHTLLVSSNMLKLLNIAHLKEKPCQQLSSGEQQLTMLATAVLHNAEVTIFDEPTANLDPQKSRDIFSLLKSSLFQSKIIITHDLNLAYKLGYDVLFMKEGKIDFQGTSQSFFTESTLNHYFGASLVRVDEGVLMKF